MPTNIQVSCIRKRGNHYNPHERIQGLGGVLNDQRWFLTEEVILADIVKPESERQWNPYVSVNGHSVWIVRAVHNGRAYLKTQPDGYSPDNLLALPECPS